MADLQQQHVAMPDLIPCPGCEEPLSPYVNKCPKCGQHTHKNSHDTAAHKQTLMQQTLLMGLGVFLFALILAFLWFFGGGAESLFGE